MKRWIALGVLACGFLTPATLPAQGKWKREVRAPTRRTEVAVAVRGGEIFVIGGLTHWGVSRLVEVYHPRKRRWRTAAPLPEPVHHPGAGVAGKRLFVVGGFGRGSFWAGVDTLYEYLPRPDAWKRRAPMPTARGALGVTVIDGKLHAVGGRNQRGDVAAHEVYDAAKRDRRGGLGRPDFRLRRRVGGGDLRGQRGLRPRPGPVDKVRPDAPGAARPGCGGLGRPGLRPERRPDAGRFLQRGQ